MNKLMTICVVVGVFLVCVSLTQASVEMAVSYTHLTLPTTPYV